MYLVSVPRVQDLREVGVAKSSSCNTHLEHRERLPHHHQRRHAERRELCDAARRRRANGSSATTRSCAKRPLAYTANDSGQNPRGIEVVTDYTDETPGTSVGTTTFLPTDINGGDCFHPSIQGQNKLADGIWTLNPDR